MNICTKICDVLLIGMYTVFVTLLSSFSKKIFSWHEVCRINKPYNKYKETSANERVIAPQPKHCTLFMTCLPWAAPLAW